jgi:hypothetical protein
MSKLSEHRKVELREDPMLMECARNSCRERAKRTLPQADLRRWSSLGSEEQMFLIDVVLAERSLRQQHAQRTISYLSEEEKAMGIPEELEREAVEMTATNDLMEFDSYADNVRQIASKLRENMAPLKLPERQGDTPRLSTPMEIWTERQRQLNQLRAMFEVQIKGLNHLQDQMQGSFRRLAKLEQATLPPGGERAVTDPSEMHEMDQTKPGKGVLSRMGSRLVDKVKVEGRTAFYMTLANKTVEYTRGPIAEQVCRLLPSANKDTIVAVLSSPLGEMLYRGALGLTLEFLPIKAIRQEKSTLAAMLRAQAMSRIMDEMVEVVAGPLIKALEQARELEQLKGSMEDPDILIEEQS